MDRMNAANSRIMAAAANAKDWSESPAGRRAQQWVSVGLSAIILLLLVHALVAIGWDNLLASQPANPLYWLFFTLSYLMLPLVDWWIYRRWWPIDWRAVGLFLRMRVMNEALFTYAGHTYLLVRATALLGIRFDPGEPPPRILGRSGGPGEDPAKNPFAAVKDMAVTSGVAGNLATLFLVLLASALGGDTVVRQALDPGTVRLMILIFGSFILLSLGILLFRDTLLSLPVAENMRAFWWHLFRVFAAHFLLVFSWAIALPQIPLETWMLLGALRMVFGRLPLPNVELLFAAVAVQLTGDASVEVAALLATQGALHLVYHGAAWGLSGLLEPARAKRAV